MGLPTFSQKRNSRLEEPLQAAVLFSATALRRPCPARSRRERTSYFTAMASISSLAPLGMAATAKQERAGQGWGKQVA